MLPHTRKRFSGNSRLRLVVALLALAWVPDTNTTVPVNIIPPPLRTPLQKKQAERLTQLAKATSQINPPVMLAPVTVVMPLAFSNPAQSYRLAIGQVLVTNGVTNGWNVIDKQDDNYYPAFYLQSSTELNSLLLPFTNVQYFPAGTRGFTNNYSSTNRQRFYRVIYAQ